MNNLVYLSYADGPHIEEIVYSVLSAVHMIGPDSRDYRIRVYTDNLAYFADLPVHAELVSEQVLANWAGPWNFGHRRKICAVKDALARFGDRVVFCDSDTFYTKHPRNAFARVRSGQTLMHIGEYRLYDRAARELAEFLRNHDVRDLAGRRWNITPAETMFNSGVIGLDESDIGLLDEAIHLTDQIYPHVRNLTIEQFALSVSFRHRTKLRQAFDLVHHYWLPERRALFHKQLDRVLSDPSISSNEERFRQLLPYRPSKRFKDRPFKGPVEKGIKARAHSVLWHAALRTGTLDSMKRIVSALGVYQKKSALSRGRS